MIAQLPTILALLGTALLALAIFAPPRAAGGPIVSFAPPIIAAPLERSPFDPFPTAPTGTPPADAFAFDEPVLDEPVLDEFGPEPSWPALVDPRALGCDAAARLGLVEALLAVRAPWADGILRRAADEERDPPVVAALAATGYAAGAGLGPAYEAGTA